MLIPRMRLTDKVDLEDDAARVAEEIELSAPLVSNDEFDDETDDTDGLLTAAR